MRVAVSERGFGSAVDELVVANQLAAHVVTTLADRLSGSGGMAGDDHTASEFAASYDDAAAASLDALESLVGAFGSLARLTEASLTNHARADADATLPAWARAVVGPRTAADGAVGVLVGAPPSSLGAATSGPGGMAGMALDHLADVFWPNADTDRVRAAGAAWREAAGSFGQLAADCDRAGTHLAHERSPEVPLALASLDQLRAHLSDLAAQLTGLGDACSDYADHVDAKRAELLSLLEDLAWELGITAGLGILGSVLSGPVGAGLATGAAGTRIAAAGAKARGILESLRLLVAGPALRTRSVGTTARELGVFTEKVNAARVMTVESRTTMRSLEQRPGWLARHEHSGSHSLAAHVRQSREDLLLQIKAGKRRASTFTDAKTADASLSNLLESHQATVRAWLKGTGDRLRLDGDMGYPTGLSMDRTGAITSVTGVRAVLVRDSSMPDGWRLLTGFPQP